MLKLLILGTTGAGKTNLARLLSRPQPRLLVVDPHRQYSDLAVEVGSVEEWARYLGSTEGTWKVSFYNDRLNRDFDALCRAVYDLGKCTLVVEETDWFCDPHFISPDFERLIKYGRHREAGVVAITRRHPEIHRLLTSQSWQLYAFSIQEPSDLDYLAKYVSPAFADGLNRLPPHSCRWQNLWDRTEPWKELRPPLA